jgi:hypothetical protein
LSRASPSALSWYCMPSIDHSQIARTTPRSQVIGMIEVLDARSQSDF